MKTVTTEEVRQWRDRGKDFLLLNVLAEEQFRKQHIPDSTNIPQDDDRFAQRVEEVAGSKDRPVVVYCASTDCTASPKAAEKLDKSGFTNVFDFEAGMAGWASARLPVESGG